MSPSVRKWRTDNSLKRVVRRIKPPCRDRAGEVSHRNRHLVRDGRIDNGQRTARCLCRHRVIIVPNVAAVAESSVSCRQQRVSLVRNKVIPSNRCDERLEISKLGYSLRVQVRLPATRKPVRPITSVHVAGQSASGQRPVFLMPQNFRCPKFTYVCFVFVILFQEQHRHYGGLVVGNQRLRIGWIISVNAVRVDARNPVRIVLRIAHIVIQLDRDQMIRIDTPQSVGYGENNSVILLDSPLLKIVTEIPDNVRRLPVAVAEELTVLLARTGSVHQRCLCPASLVKRGKHTLQPVCSSLLHDVIDVAPIGLIRRC